MTTVTVVVAAEQKCVVGAPLASASPLSGSSPSRAPPKTPAGTSAIEPEKAGAAAVPSW